MATDITIPQRMDGGRIYASLHRLLIIARNGRIVMRLYDCLLPTAYCLLLLLLPLSFTGLQAQKTDISIRAFPSSWYHSYFEPGLDGMGLCVTYHPILNNLTRLNISGELAVLRSRNEALIGFGINHTFWQAKHFRISIEANLLNGIDLYKPYPLYVGGIEGVARFDYYLKKGLTLFAGIGARGMVCPGYRDIGVWWHSSWPVMLGIRI